MMKKMTDTSKEESYRSQKNKLKMKLNEDKVVKGGDLTTIVHHINRTILLLPGMSFPFLQGILARVLGLWLIDLLEHHKIDPMLSVSIHP